MLELETPWTLTTAALIGALIPVLVNVFVCRYVLSADLEEEKTGYLRVIIVVWQI